MVQELGRETTGLLEPNVAAFFQSIGEKHGSILLSAIA